MLTKRVKRIFAAVALAPLLLTACEGNPFDPFDEATGTYDLTVFADASVPATFSCGPADCPNGGTVRVNSGTLVLHADGSYVERNNFTFDEPQGSRNGQFVSTGTFTLNGENLSLDDDDGTRFINASLQVLPDRIRVSYDEDGESYEYIKR